MCSVVLLYWTKKSLNNYNYVPRDRTDGEVNYIFKKTTFFLKFRTHIRKRFYLYEIFLCLITNENSHPDLKIY